MTIMQTVELSLDALDLKYAQLRGRHFQAEKRLLLSLGEAGQQSPVIVVAGAEAGRYVLIDGRKRVRALRQLRADVVKAAVWEMSAPQALVAAYQLQDGTGWNAIEEGWLVWQLVRVEAMSTAEAGRSLERSKAWISGRLGLVESLPEAVQEGVRCGKIGAYTATRHLLAFARANAGDCESLAAKVMESGFRSREVESLCRYYASAGRDGRRRMLEDPARFLKALEAAKRKDGASSEEGRCLKNLEIIGNISLNLARSLPPLIGSDTAASARERLQPAWERARRRWSELDKTAAMVFAPEGAGKEAVHA